MDTWEEKREESCKHCMHVEEEEGVRRHGGTGVVEGISDKLEHRRGVKRVRRNTVDESSEKEWEKLSSWASQTSQPTSIPQGALEHFVSGLLLILHAPLAFVLSTFPSVLSGSRLLLSPSPAPLWGSMLVPANTGG